MFAKIRLHVCFRNDLIQKSNKYYSEMSWSVSKRDVWVWKTVDQQKNPLQIATQCPLYCPTFTRAPLPCQNSVLGSYKMVCVQISSQWQPYSGAVPALSVNAGWKMKEFGISVSFFCYVLRQNQNGNHKTKDNGPGVCVFLTDKVSVFLFH